VFHQYTIRVLNGKRDRLAQFLGEQGIGTMIYYPIPQDCLPIYRDQYPANPFSLQLAQEVLSLPMWPEMERSTLEEIVDTIQTFFRA
ncbi:MAG: DegT/DnrJ/EryC1/StrS family aminotransferase, partial [Microcystaceae cyanobacterium]